MQAGFRWAWRQPRCLVRAGWCPGSTRARAHARYYVLHALAAARDPGRPGEPRSLDRARDRVRRAEVVMAAVSLRHEELRAQSTIPVSGSGRSRAPQSAWFTCDSSGHGTWAVGHCGPGGKILPAARWFPCGLPRSGDHYGAARWGWLYVSAWSGEAPAGSSRWAGGGARGRGAKPRLARRVGRAAVGRVHLHRPRRHGWNPAAGRAIRRSRCAASTGAGAARPGPQALIPGRMQSHASQRKYPEELRERAVKMVLGIRDREGKGRSEIARVGRQLGIRPEALRTWIGRPKSTAGRGLERRRRIRGGSPNWNVKCVNCGGRTRS